jgi:NADH-quinone oxidoreductase subunit A
VLDNWLPFLIYGFFALIIPASMMWFSFALATRPHRRMRARTTPFESGVSTGPPREQRFTISFYLTAMLLELLFFVVILVVAYVYIWRKGALEWH